RAEEGRQHLDGGGLTRPVRAEEREDLAGADLERDAIDGADVAERLDQVLDVDHRLPSEGGEPSRPVPRARPGAFPGAVLPKRPPSVSASAGPWRVESVQPRGRSIRAQDGIPDLVRAVAVPRAVQPPHEMIRSAVPFEHGLPQRCGASVPSTAV